MARRNKTTINRCTQCGSILNKSVKVNKIISDADESLDRFYNKNIRKKK
jgi:hypothetical protein|tara:strand:- start:432 stop:578 length:147 start_codon:yes stop_codon:yes gene_type:complete